MRGSNPVKITIAAILALAFASLAAPAVARGGYHEARSEAPCGWTNGALPNPAETQRCLAARFKPAKPKPARGGQAPTNGTAAPQPSGGTGG